MSLPQSPPINEQTSKLALRSGFSRDQIIRQIVRVRLSNVYGADPLLVGVAHVSLRSTGAATEHSEGLTTYISAEGHFSGARAAA